MTGNYGINVQEVFKKHNSHYLSQLSNNSVLPSQQQKKRLISSNMPEDTLDALMHPDNVPKSDNRWLDGKLYFGKDIINQGAYNPKYFAQLPGYGPVKLEKYNITEEHALQGISINAMYSDIEK